MKIPFYLLGLLLRFGPQHGYRLKQIIEEEISDFAKIKLPTIYYHLDKLMEKGYVTETLDKDGNRPEKFVYSITESGKEYFNDLFINLLMENYYPEFPIDGVLYFKDKIDKVQLQKEFERKKEEVIKKLERVKRHKVKRLSNILDQGRFSAEAIFEHHICHLEAEFIWLEKIIEGLAK